MSFLYYLHFSFDFLTYGAQLVCHRVYCYSLHVLNFRVDFSVFFSVCSVAEFSCMKKVVTATVIYVHDVPGVPKNGTRFNFAITSVNVHRF